MKAQQPIQKNGSEILIETLIEQGVTDIFGYPGGQVLHIYDALYQAEGRIRHILTAHEQGAAHAADGYARATGKVGVVIATSGPGATNLVTGIATAMLDSIPMVAITGNVATSLVGRDSFQEVNITGITMPITKHNYFVTDVRDLADCIREAFQIAKSGRPGPVLIDIPKDVQQALCLFTPKGVVKRLGERIAPDSDIERAAELLRNAKRPYLYIGGGAVSAGITDDIIQMAETIDAYIGCTLMGLSAFPHSYDRFLGMQGMHGKYAASRAYREADVILAVGVRFSDRAVGEPGQNPHTASVIHLDTDISEINKNLTADVGLVGNIESSFSRILAKCEPQCHPTWQKKILSFRKQGRAIMEQQEQLAGDTLTPKKLFDIINAEKDDDTMIVTDVGQHQMWTAQYIKLERPRRLATSGGLGTMGYGMGAAIGAYIACGSKPVLITGDGSFGMNLNELATAVTYHIPMVIVLMNNGVLGLVRQMQTLFYEHRYACTELQRRTDFVKLAEAFGARAGRADTVEAFQALFREAMASDMPFLIDTQIDPNALVLPMLPPGGSMDHLITTIG